MNLISYLTCLSLPIIILTPVSSALADTAYAETLLSGTQTIQTQSVTINGITRYKLHGVTAGGVEFETRSGGAFAYGHYANGVEIFDGNNDNYWDEIIDNSSSSLFPTAALDVHWATEKTLNYFSDVLGVNSYDGMGGAVTANAHSYRLGSWEYQNGIYSFSDRSTDSNQLPWVSVDLVAHEIAHSMLDSLLANAHITSVPSFLAEGFPDVIGIAVRHYAKPTTATFEFADEIYFSGDASLRSLSNPKVDTYLSSDWYSHSGSYNRGGVLGKWYYLSAIGGSGINAKGFAYHVEGLGTDLPVNILYNAFENISGSVSVEDFANATIISAFNISETAGNSITNAWRAVGIESQQSSWQRTVIFIYGETVDGQDLFVRGGIDHAYANSILGRSCSNENVECAMPIQHNNLLNPTTSTWKYNDTYLDWYGPQQGQSSQANGTPLDWTTDYWPLGWGQQRSVDIDGFGYTPLNTYGSHYWMLDVNMDCSAAVDGWFELKSYVSNGDGWEPDIQQSDAPYSTGNHFAQCGKINVFVRGQDDPLIIRSF
ncbi:M4 family metallopeptidase [Glaciecola sp. MH2013]|uniref:M4 family metallopeptidase n=1 Tax=Glaciecola sp. MH2013 TaxID=2785524 RepID=UPI00189D0823|nr:M4 family metallopeptidase [Glaciecola sp. MH2013]MBF7073223.1 M4 family metallopeptidase [Glaciecola sp. MH2013]